MQQASFKFILKGKNYMIPFGAQTCSMKMPEAFSYKKRFWKI